MFVDWFTIERCRFCFKEFDWAMRRPYTICGDCADTVYVTQRIEVIQNDECAILVGYGVCYDEPVVSRMVRRLKFHGDSIVAVDLALWAEGACVQLINEMGVVPHVVPVPLHWTRLWGRGYNQSERIAEALCDVVGLELAPHILRRSKRTMPHAKLDKTKRARNIVGAFKAKKAPKHPPPILLVDDVLTTGATLLACAKELHLAGYPKVAALTVARTL
jgi:ComF family protein